MPIQIGGGRESLSSFPCCVIGYDLLNHMITAFNLGETAFLTAISGTQTPKGASQHFSGIRQVKWGLTLAPSSPFSGGSHDAAKLLDPVEDTIHKMRALQGALLATFNAHGKSLTPSSFALTKQGINMLEHARELFDADSGSADNVRLQRLRQAIVDVLGIAYLFFR
jgi:hypothetical protein